LRLETVQIVQVVQRVQTVEEPRSKVVKIGIVEGWNAGLMGSKPYIPIFQYSNTPLRMDASEIF
jgi:hypothetical protein